MKAKRCSRRTAKLARTAEEVPRLSRPGQSFAPRGRGRAGRQAHICTYQVNRKLPMVRGNGRGVSAGQAWRGTRV